MFLLILFVPRRFQSCYSEAELKLFKLIIQEIATNEHKFVDPIVCINLCCDIKPKPLQKTKAENFMDKLVTRGYLHVTETEVMFGPTFLVEFASYLRSNYPENIFTCSLCSTIVLKTEQCLECENAFHKVCLLKYFNQIKQANKPCPNCKTMWPVKLE